jgi:hypothetical protein
MEMHNLVIFGLVVNIIIRFVGAIVSLDMYSKTRDSRHFLQTIGWVFLFISGFFPFGITFTHELFVANLFLVSTVVGLNIGLYLLLTGLAIYFSLFLRKIIVASLLAIIIIPVSLFILTDAQTAINISVLFQFLTITVFLTLAYSSRNEIKTLLQYSYSLLVLLIVGLIVFLLVHFYIITSVPDYSYGLYMSTDSVAIMAFYSAAAAISLLGLMLFLHLEQGIYLKTKDILKDDYSHKIGNILQIVVGATTSIKGQSESNEIQTTADLILERSEEAGELITKIREM